MKNKEKQRKGLIFQHRETKLPALWITQYNSNWNNKEDSNLYRVRDSKDLPDFIFPVSDLHMPQEIWESSRKEGIYCYLQAFFYDFCKNKKDRKEADKNVLDWWFLLLPSGFPNKKISSKK